MSDQRPIPTAAGRAASDERIETPATHEVATWQHRYGDALLGVFGTPKTVLVRGEGVYVWDADGTRYLDLLAGIAVNALGHAHPTLTGAIGAQLATLGHVSNFFATPTQVALAERLLTRTGAPEGSRVFFTNSGTEANEAAFKIARRNRGEDGRRTRIIALEGSFHGRTMGALALTSKAAYREPFEPLPGGVEFVPAGDLAALEAAFAADGEGGPDASTVAAVFLELVQGEGGVLPLPEGYLARARELTSAHGALLIVDEVQTGMGRTGHWLALQDPALGGGVVPDVVTLAKGLGGGFPIGAVVTYGERGSHLLSPGQHGTTFGGNPVAAAAALATIGVIERDDLLASVTAVGEHIRSQVRGMAGEGPLVTGVRGAGLLIGVQLAADVAAQVTDLAQRDGFIVNAVSPSVVRLAPPLVITREQVQPFLDWLRDLNADPASRGVRLPTADDLPTDDLPTYEEPR